MCACVCVSLPVLVTLSPPLQLMIRDYGRYDAAQLRFRGHQKLDEHLYVRQDGTRAYFFHLVGHQSPGIVV